MNRFKEELAARHFPWKRDEYTDSLYSIEAVRYDYETLTVRVYHMVLTETFTFNRDFSYDLDRVEE